jgi:hypothetical protein
MTEGQQGPTPRKKARHFRRAKSREKKTPQVAAIESYIRSPDHAVSIHTQPPHKKTRLSGGIAVAGLTMGRTGPCRCIHSRARDVVVWLRSTFYAAAFARFAVIAIVALLQPVAACMLFQDWQQD